MKPAEIITLINIMSQFAEVINISVVASDDEEAKAAWLDAQRRFNKSFLASYEIMLKNGEDKQTANEEEVTKNEEEVTKNGENKQTDTEDEATK